MGKIEWEVKAACNQGKTMDSGQRGEETPVVKKIAQGFQRHVEFAESRGEAF